MSYVNEQHNEAVRVEESLHEADRVLTDLSNMLYKQNPEHPLLEEIGEAIHSVEVVTISLENNYEEAQTAAGESWWEKA
ncbi:hypothetical protein [Cryobacterium zhongshanensis]|uniref:Uncharacterized protein n=1 Tax=Cryobacterium zhongshanensis TaxID=2928153 RepID=A0AA41QXW3_9MICO|nr:hypothetical protein [Cryobacterium zhongshanensis]MCI4659696.1 hypothetical protein [Cryobacterium zhongshanensis]